MFVVHAFLSLIHCDRAARSYESYTHATSIVNNAVYFNGNGMTRRCETSDDAGLNFNTQDIFCCSFTKAIAHCVD